MEPQSRNLANKLANESVDDNNDNEDILNTEADDEVNKEKLEDEQNIKSVELTSKDATNLNPNNSIKKNGILVNANSNNLTKKKNTNSTRNLTQRQNPSVNIATEDGNKSLSTEKSVMHNLNKVAMNLLNHQIVMKLFHFQTKLYGAHKTSDAYLEKFATTMDKFLEIAQGIYGRLTITKFKLEGSSHTDENIIKHIEGIIILLRTGIDDVLDNYTDLINVRDELVGDVEQLKYLLSFK